MNSARFKKSAPNHHRQQELIQDDPSNRIRDLRHLSKAIKGLEIRKVNPCLGSV